MNLYVLAHILDDLILLNNWVKPEILDWEKYPAEFADCFKFNPRKIQMQTKAVFQS